MAANPTGRAPSIRAATWNLARSGGADRTQLLADQHVELLCAQEVTRRAHDDILASGVFGWGLLSLDHRPRFSGGNSEQLGVAIYGHTDLKVRASGIIAESERPEKFLHADLTVAGWRQPVSVASFHAAPGPGKPETTLRVAHWLEFQFGPSMMGLDANSPSVDHPDHEQSVFCWTQAPYSHFERALIGPPSARRHRLDDALRVRLRHHPDEASPLTDIGPLATTHDRDKTRTGHTPSRFDSIWVSPEFAVGPVTHLWDHDTGRGLGGSDHAMVVTDLTPAVELRPKGENIVAYLRRCRIIPNGTTLVLNTELITDDADRRRLDEWIAADRTRGEATWHNDGVRELTWQTDGTPHTVGKLAKTICDQAGVEFPLTPAGPHWWLDPRHGNESLAQIESGG